MRPQFTSIPLFRFCSVPHCDQLAKARGLCAAHHWRWWKYGDPCFVPIRVRSLEERFWAYVARGEPDECWLWQSTISGNGYGQIRVGDGGPRRYLLAHRVAWEVCRGPIPDEMLVLHHCDVRACCNPAHLFLGSQRDNVIDMIEKGRQVIHVTLMGSMKPSAKLVEPQVVEIRGRYAQGERNVSALSREFGVSHAVIRDILSRRKWKHVV